MRVYLIAGLIGVVSSVIATYIVKWRDRRSAIESERKKQRSARQQELYDYRVRLAKEDRVKWSLLFHRGHFLKVLGTAWHVASLVVISIGLVAVSIVYPLLIKDTLSLQTLSSADVNMTRIVGMGVLGIVFGVSGFMGARGQRYHRDGDELLKPAISVVPDSDLPLVFEQSSLDYAQFDVKTGTPKRENP